jgi:hypothetical protein
VHPDLDCSSWAPGFVRGEFVEVLHGFRGDSDLFGRLVGPDADPAEFLSDGAMLARCLLRRLEHPTVP